MGKVDELLPVDPKVGEEPEEGFEEVPLSVVPDVPSNVTESIQSACEGRSMNSRPKKTLDERMKGQNVLEID